MLISPQHKEVHHRAHREEETVNNNALGEEPPVRQPCEDARKNAVPEEEGKGNDDRDHAALDPCSWRAEAVQDKVSQGGKYREKGGLKQ